MRKLLLSLLVLISYSVYGQRIVHPAGKTHTKIMIEPGGTYKYYDDGGPNANYTSRVNSMITIYPSEPGQKVSIKCNSFDIGSDCRMYIFDGNHGGADILKLYQLRTVERSHQMKSGDVVTASDKNESGALTIRFANSGQRGSMKGWDFSVSCTSTPGKAPYKTTQDCSGAIKVCDNKAITTKAKGYHMQELPGPKFWNVILNYGNAGENQSNWYKFEVATPGTIEFVIKPHTKTDFDWALWGPYNSHQCPAYTTKKPLRISACDGDNSQLTGLSKVAKDKYEDSWGDGFVAAINVKKGEHYVLMIDDWSGNNTTFDLMWRFSNGASLECKKDKDPPPKPTKNEVVEKIKVVKEEVPEKDPVVEKVDTAKTVKPIETVETIDTIQTLDTASVTVIDLCADKMSLESELKDITSDQMGSIDVTVHGGNPPYKYQWKDGFGNKLTTMEDLFGVPGGKYDLEITDKNDCVLIGNFTLTIEQEFVEVDKEPELEVEVDPEEAFVTVSYPGHFEYKIENLNGETVITGHSIDEDLLEITKLPPGTYRVSLIHKKIRKYTSFRKH